MALEEYVRKRRFENTPEPAPASKGSKTDAKALPRFYIQRHDATRLHYDFRLEIGGVLVSWAVPKGPSLEPLSKHLAAKVEDHPLEYGDFEGNIPAGNYGAGSVMLWDRGTWELLGDVPVSEQLARGDLKFRLHGEKINGEFALIHMKNRGKGNEWLLIKKRDEYARPGWDIEQHAWSVLSGRTQQEIAQGLPARKTKQTTAGDPRREWTSSRPARAAAAPRIARAAAAPRKKKIHADPAKLKGAVKAPMPESVTPMKAELTDKPPAGEDWLFEIKWDGVRAVCFIENETIRLASRTGHSCDKQYPELSVIPHYVAAGQAILDGEIAALDDKGVARFELIQPRIAQSDPNTVAHLSRSRPVVYYAFDLLYLNGYDLRQVPLIERKQLLQSILTQGGGLRFSEHFPGAGEAMLQAAREAGLEGIVAKRANSCYEPRRSREWLKLKIMDRQEFLICGFTAGEREHFGALVLGVYDKGRLVWAGNVGTGFDQKTLASLRGKLEPLVTPKSPFPDAPKVGKDVTWVRPELVAEIKFTNWTADRKLRAPVYLGLRADVAPRDAVLEQPGQSGAASEPLLGGSQEDVTLTIDGKSLKFTNLNKIYYPADNIAKRDILNYYDSVADLILPHLKDRPLSLKRYPNGINQQFFFQKDAPLTFAPWLRTEEIDSEHNGAPIRYVFAQDRASLLYLVNLGCIDHNPWMSRSQSLDNPDFILIDLDPQDCPFDLIIEAALMVREKLEAIGLEGYPKTTGGDGLHVYIPLEPVYTYDQSRTFAEILALLVQRDRPEMFTTPRAVSKRQKGRVYFDYLQNGKSKTIAAPYVLRAYPGAPVATPLAWDEVRPGLTPDRFNIHNAPERFAGTGDLFAGVLTRLQRIEEPLQKLDALLRRKAAQ